MIKTCGIHIHVQVSYMIVHVSYMYLTRACVLHVYDVNNVRLIIHNNSFFK